LRTALPPRLLPLSNIAFAIFLRCCNCFPLLPSAASRPLPRRWWTGKDSNLRSPQGAADLQSAGFSHSPTRPRKHVDTRYVPVSEKRSCLLEQCAKTQNGLVSKDTSPFMLSCRELLRPHSPDEKWWSWRRELNPRPSDYKSDALPAELRQRCSNRTRIAD
jgi:hypothetical protein